jgi:hypothetical protein
MNDDKRVKFLSIPPKARTMFIRMICLRGKREAEIRKMVKDEMIYIAFGYTSKGERIPRHYKHRVIARYNHLLMMIISSGRKEEKNANPNCLRV